jgi:hypothetical protein
MTVTTGAREVFELGVLALVGQQRFRIVLGGSEGLVAHLFHQDHRGFLVQHLVDGAHLAQLHQLLDDLGCLHRHLVRQFGHGDGFRNVDVLDDRLGRGLEIGFAVVVPPRRPPRPPPARQPSRPPVERRATALHAAARSAALLVVRPGRRHIGRLDRLLVARLRRAPLLVSAGLASPGLACRPACAAWCWLPAPSAWRRPVPAP